MATDISLYIETYTPGKGWKYMGSESDIMGERYLEKNYGLYAILANDERDVVRIDENTTRSYIPIVHPRSYLLTPIRNTHTVKNHLRRIPMNPGIPGGLRNRISWNIPIGTCRYGSMGKVELPQTLPGIP